MSFVFVGSNGLWGEPTSPMIGATGSRHMSARRRSSAAAGISPSHMLLGSRSSGLGSLSEAGDGSTGSARQPVARRRAVDTSDLRSCALVQTKMKTWKKLSRVSIFYYLFH